MLMKKKLMLLLLALSFVLSVSSPLFAANNGKININQAGVEELVTLDQVGEKYAQRIVEYRQTNGPFKKPEDIMKIKGIGSKIWEANKDRIAVE